MPFSKVRLTAIVVEPPDVTVPEAGFNDVEKSNAGVGPDTSKL